MAVVWEQFAISLLYLVIVIETELYFQVEPTATANRWSRVEKKRIVVPMPKMIEKYNQKMSGVDLLDAMVAVYRIRIRKRKWWWSIYAWSLSVSAVNAWRLMCHVKKSKIPYLEFLRQTVMEMMTVHLSLIHI